MPNASRASPGVSAKLIPLLLVLGGCATKPCFPVKIPELVPIPDACASACPTDSEYPEVKPGVPLDNVFRAYMQQRESLACYRARLQCVRDLNSRRLDRP